MVISFDCVYIVSKNLVPFSEFYDNLPWESCFAAGAALAGKRNASMLLFVYIDMTRLACFNISTVNR